MGAKYQAITVNIDAQSHEVTDYKKAQTSIWNVMKLLQAQLDEANRIFAENRQREVEKNAIQQD